MVKYALLIGINYRGTNAELRGCINDVHTIKKYLINKRGYSDSNITVLTEDEVNKPTCKAIMHELAKLILRSQKGDVEELWFHYSGHGSYVKDRDGDEDDGKDETLVPLDYKRGGMITDDQIHDYLEHLPDDCKMYCIIDCCHSGTMLDLKYQYKGGSRNGIENVKSKLKGNIKMFSGCMDTQTSADAYISGKWAGAMTSAYVNCIKEDINCEDLLNKMRQYMASNGYTQYPQLCCSHKIDQSVKW